jgi:hypothetical protein
MSFLKAERDGSTQTGGSGMSAVLHDLDRVKLKKAVTVEGT